MPSLIHTVLDEISSSLSLLFAPTNDNNVNRFVFCFSTSSPWVIPALINQQQQQQPQLQKLKSPRVLEIQNYCLLILIEDVEFVPTIVAFVLSICARYSTNSNCSNHDVGFCDFSVAPNSSSGKPNLSPSILLTQVQQLLISVDPIYSPILVSKNDDNARISNIQLPEDLLLLFPGSSSSSSSLTLEKVFLSNNTTHTNVVWNGFASSNNRKRNYYSLHQNNELISRYLAEFCQRIKNKKVESNNNTSRQVHEKKWGIWLAQKIIANKNNDDISSSSSTSVIIKEGAQKLEKIFHHQKTNQNHYFEKLLRDCTNSILERRGINHHNNNTNSTISANQTSPLRKIVSYFSPASQKKIFQSVDANSQQENLNQNNNDNNDSDQEDETEAILRALTEKKKSMTLAKRAEEWFAELSARGVPAPLKQLAMVIPYHWRFWLTPMGFLVIGTSFMMLFGVVLLFM